MKTINIKDEEGYVLTFESGAVAVFSAKELKDIALQRQESRPPPSSPFNVSVTERKLLASDGTSTTSSLIKAIRVFRERTGWSLRQSKKYLELFRDSEEFQAFLSPQKRKR